MQFILQLYNSFLLWNSLVNVCPYQFHRNQQAIIIKVSTELFSVSIHDNFFMLFFTGICLHEFFFFHSNQKLTIIRNSSGMISVYIHASFYFVLTDFHIKDAAEPSTITVCLFDIRINTLVVNGTARLIFFLDYSRYQLHYLNY